MRKVFFVIIIVFIFPSLGLSWETKTVGGYYACVSPTFAKDIESYSTMGDSIAVEKLVESRMCYLTKSGERIDVMENLWPLVMIRQIGSTQKLWTSKDNIVYK